MTYGKICKCDQSPFLIFRVGPWDEARNWYVVSVFPLFFLCALCREWLVLGLWATRPTLPKKRLKIKVWKRCIYALCNSQSPRSSHYQSRILCKEEIPKDFHGWCIWVMGLRSSTLFTRSTRGRARDLLVSGTGLVTCMTNQSANHSSLGQVGQADVTQSQPLYRVCFGKIQVSPTWVNLFTFTTTIAYVHVVFPTIAYVPVVFPTIAYMWPFS